MDFHVVTERCGGWYRDCKFQTPASAPRYLYFHILFYRKIMSKHHGRLKAVPWPPFVFLLTCVIREG